MVEHPETYIDDFAKAGADMIVVHAEATKHLHRCLQYIKSKGVKAGVALNPATPLCMVQEVLGDADMVLLMRKMIAENGLACDIQVDGGINAETSKIVLEAGANILVAGSYVYGAEDTAAAIASLKA